jgi:hypothetical protein
LEVGSLLLVTHLLLVLLAAQLSLTDNHFYDLWPAQGELHLLQEIGFNGVLEEVVVLHQLAVGLDEKVKILLSQYVAVKVLFPLEESVKEFGVESLPPQRYFVVLVGGGFLVQTRIIIALL